MSQPKNWPIALPYLRAPLHSKDLTPDHLTALYTRPSSSSSSSNGSSSMPIVPASETPTPCPRVKIQAIQHPSHPAHGQHGLFAAQHLKPGSLILAYLGRVHGGRAADADASASDYDLWLDRDADVAVDAAREGNEARFVNDFRGVGPRANAEFRNVFCERWGQVCVGVWVLGAGKGKGKKKSGTAVRGGEGGEGGGKRGGDGGIRKGEEILVSYGKGFWEERRREMEGSGVEDGGTA